MRMKKMNRGWPFSDENEMQEIKAVLESHTWWRGTGNKVKEFERCFANYHNVNYALGVSNGTHALEIALEVLGVMPGDEVIVPAFTFVATATAVLRRGAIPVFCDVDADTYCLMPESFNEKITNKTKAVIPVHMAGHLCDMEKISKVAMENNIRIIEDAAHAQGGEWNGKKVGFYSDIATFSFQNRKVMTCGEGGALITNSKELYDKLCLYRTHGITKDSKLLTENHGGWYYEMQELGFNYRITDFQAALGISQLKRADAGLKRRQLIARRYNEAFAKNDNIKTPFVSDDVFHAYHLYIIQVEDRLGLYNYLREQGIYAQVHYVPLHLMPYYAQRGNKKGDFPVVEDYYEHCLSLPIYPTLTDEEQSYVIANVLRFLNK